MNGIYEVIMLLCFFAAWPMSVVKSYRARTTTGKKSRISDYDYCRLCCWNCEQVYERRRLCDYFYVINLLIVGVDLVLYFRNLRLDKKEWHPIKKKSRLCGVFYCMYLLI